MGRRKNAPVYERKAITELIPADWNPRKISRKQLSGLQASIDRYGLVQPIVWNKRSGNVVGGHQRLKVLASREVKETTVAVVDLSDADEKRLNVTLNNPNVGGEFTDNLQELLAELQDIDPDEFLTLNLDELLADSESEVTQDGDGNGDGDVPGDDKLPEEVEPTCKVGESYEIGRHVLHCGDCVEVMRAIPTASIDSIVTDPPYGLGFMGKEWDELPPGKEWAEECLRVLKPGSHIIAFGGTRTVHRLACVLEDAGFEIRDTISWLQWQGFPKSLDVSKAIDDAAGAERTVPAGPTYTVPDARKTRPHFVSFGDQPGAVRKYQPMSPVTLDAKRWNGWGTALKPTQEPAILARKPLSGTVAENVLEHGVGGLNIDGCRFAYGDDAWPGPQDKDDCRRSSEGGDNGLRGTSTFKIRKRTVAEQALHDGRWPANIYHCPKPARSEREAGLREAGLREAEDAGVGALRDGGRGKSAINIHPTVKPVRLMRWLVRLVTPPGGRVLEPFLGSGTTMIACEREGLMCVGIEREPGYADIAIARTTEAQDGSKKKE